MPAGAATKYKDWMLPVIKQMLILGATDEEVYTTIGISKTCFGNWKNTNEELLTTIKRAKEYPDSNVVKSLYNQAIGYEYKEDIVTKSGLRVTLTRHEKPNVIAAIFWLKNRLPADWRDKIEVDHHHTIEDGMNQKQDELVASGAVPGPDHEPMNIHCECPHCRVRRGEQKEIARSVNASRA